MDWMCYDPPVGSRILEVVPSKSMKFPGSEEEFFNLHCKLALLVAMIVEDIFILRFWYSDACFRIDVSLLHFLQNNKLQVHGPEASGEGSLRSGHGPWSNISGERISTQINIPWSWSGILATGGEQTKSHGWFLKDLTLGPLHEIPCRGSGVHWNFQV